MTKSDKVLVILFRYLLGIGSLFALVPVVITPARKILTPTQSASEGFGSTPSLALRAGGGTQYWPRSRFHITPA